jgi:hypothetical protein
MNSTPTTRELKVKMDEMCEDIQELKVAIKEGFADLKRDLELHYVSNERFKPVETFVNNFMRIGFLILVAILGLVLSHVIPGFKL